MRTKTRSKMVRSFIALIVLVVLVYGVWQARKLLFGPTVIITAPHDGQTVATEIVSIHGRVKNTQELFINDTQTLIAEDGTFSKKLLLAPGYSILEVVARDRFGTEKTEYVSLWRGVPEQAPQEEATSTATTSQN